MNVAHRCLADDGLSCFTPSVTMSSRVTGDPWINKYIFPGGMLLVYRPSRKGNRGEYDGRLAQFEYQYDKTLLAWFKNFDAAWLAPSGVEAEAERKI